MPMLIDKYLFHKVTHQPTPFIFFAFFFFFKFTFIVVPQQENVFSNMLVMIFLYEYRTSKMTTYKIYNDKVNVKEKVLLIAEH